MPNILIVSLNRFKEESLEKVTELVSCPLEGAIKDYDLKGVVNHYGSVNGGHYTANVKNGE